MQRCLKFGTGQAYAIGEQMYLAAMVMRGDFHASYTTDSQPRKTLAELLYPVGRIMIGQAGENDASSGYPLCQRFWRERRIAQRGMAVEIDTYGGAHMVKHCGFGSQINTL